MLKRIVASLLISTLLPLALFADEASDQEYIKKLTYQRNRLELVTKQREIDERRSYSYTDIDSYTYSYEAYAHTSTDISTQTLDRSEKKEVTDWYIYKGGLRQISDPEFLELVGAKTKLALVLKEEEQKARLRGFGNILIGTGLAVMLGGAAFSAPEGTTTAGALGMTAGFFLNAFNLSPQHYIEPDFAQEKIDEYNINLKRNLGLPLSNN
ncbi:MAG: hypothetical protein KJ732_06835 [Candidatus Margulisbacteria bacterium]|nr:hypothetical protein [Candidatus Margulisiibacteriota bacterium]